MAKRRNARERDEAIAHEQAEARREALLAELRAREAAARPEAPPPAATEPSEATPAAPAQSSPAVDGAEPE